MYQTTFKGSNFSWLSSQPVDFWWRFRPETSVIFLLCGTGYWNFSRVILYLVGYYHSIVPNAPQFVHSFLLLMTFVKGISQKRQSYSVVLELSLCYSYLSDSPLHTSIFAKFFSFYFYSWLVGIWCAMFHAKTATPSLAGFT